ncbi:hypothetical protein JB92DRAFT_3034979 [Gautieria morchelliformis]|nr:hypothetical protein JB92DRAFT_3034979 [Gautieria morchelliformis]
MSTPRQPGCPDSMGILYLCGTHQKRLTSRYSVADLCVCAPSTIACAGAPNQHDQDTPGLGVISHGHAHCCSPCLTTGSAAPAQHAQWDACR